MRTPKALYPRDRLLFHPELIECPRCGEGMTLANYLRWDKTVQSLDGVLSVASRPGRCPEVSCPAYRSPIESAEGLQIAPVGFGYGYDVIVRIGWLHQEGRATFGEVHQTLAETVQISEAHVRYLYQQVYLPLLACHERQFREQLETAARPHGGLLIALDGLAPEGGEPQLWFVRELTMGLTLRSGWMSAQDQGAFEALLRPLADLEWPIRVVLSDKQKGLVPAVATVLPDSLHAFCQAHYLKNLSSPLADADRTLNVELRKAVRAQIGPEVRAESVPGSPLGVLTVTGLLPDRLPEEIPEEIAEDEASGDDDATPIGPASRRKEAEVTVTKASEEDAIADAIVLQLQRRIRYLLTLDSRPPFVLAGIEAYARLMEIVEFCEEIGRHRSDPRLIRLSEGLRQALAPFSGSVCELQQGAEWLRKIAQILDPSEPVSGAEVSKKLREYLDELLSPPKGSPLLGSFCGHLDAVSRSYGSGLFHSYDLPEVPRTNNGLESHFRDTQRRLLRTTGQKGQTRRTLQRTGAWELLPRPGNETERWAALRQVGPCELRRERQRLRQHRERFRLHTRSPRRAGAQLDHLRQQWLSLQPTSSG
jgi:hypothetical protein